jgi:hypothetical protein
MLKMGIKISLKLTGELTISEWRLFSQPIAIVPNTAFGKSILHRVPLL